VARVLELEIEMQYMCNYLYYEIDNTESVQEQQKLVVAEFGLLDVQVVAMSRMLAEASAADAGRGGDKSTDDLPYDFAIEGLLQGAEMGTGRGSNSNEVASSLDDASIEQELDLLLASTGWGGVGAAVRGVGFVDADELSVVAIDVEDLAGRLGLDEVLGDKAIFSVPKFSPGQLGRKMAEAASFYIQGSKLLAQDVQYALKLFLKAILGETLAPREVRSVRRTAKDVVTFIPFIIILIIPLTPVGHVLVFSFIQRFFPDFFPTPYTDRRQNLMRIYQSVEMAMPTGGSERKRSQVLARDRASQRRRQ